MLNTKINVITGQCALVLAFFIFTLNFLYWNENLVYMLSGLLCAVSLLFNLRHLLLLRKRKEI